MEEWNRVWQMMNIHLGPPSPPMDLYRETVAVYPEDSQPLEGTSGASRSAIAVNSRNVQLQNEGQSLEVDGPGSFSEETNPKEIVKTDKNTYPSFKNSEIPSQPSEIELDKHSTAGSSGLKHKILQFAIFHVFNGTNQTY
ncbi:uncharacterized protein LOC132549560 [Ylistrum balloti]|uniref:uncharacterized protein LOC132549560 n=1 Tax=Ylistrum balloti TaxID=509963 RepID=UPI002905B591|nr:uncharacterized protein LOC132549560 [Ylistrum balloti]